MQISITIEGYPLYWSRWKQLLTELQALGFAGIFKSDHYFVGLNTDSLETIIALTYLADHIADVHFGTLVAPVSFRDPVMLARQAMILDDLSNGRMILGIGSGWSEAEHVMFGYKLGTIKERMDRFAEGLEVITQLIRSDQPATFEGRYFHLREAQLLPRPQRPTPILVGGHGPSRTLPLVAKYADIWNCQVASVELFTERNALLDELLRSAGRQPNAVKRTVMVPVLCWQTQAERKQVLADIDEKLHDMFGGSDGVQAFLQNQMAALLGAPEPIIEKMRAYEAAGVEEFIIQYFGMAGSTGLEILAEQILPHFA